MKHLMNKTGLKSIQIELTSRCNERCIHCYIPDSKKIYNIEPALYYNIINQCCELGILNIVLSGGEPLLHPRFIEFFNYAKSRGFSFIVASNLTLLDNEIISAIKSLKSIMVQVSLYSMDKKIHDEITKLSGSFIKTQQAILNLMDNNIPVSINCPILKPNRYSFLDVYKWARNININTYFDFVIIGRYDYTSDNLDSRLSLEEAEIVMQNIIESDSEYRNEIFNINYPEKNDIENDDERICSACTHSLCVNANGDVYPCPGWQNYILGNLNNTSLDAIYYKSQKLQNLKNLRKKDFPKCLSCTDKLYCEMCLVQNVNESGDMFSIPEYCCGMASLKHKFFIKWKENHLSRSIP
jgi:radical SAM protein with 4Fe4S-binding SPASM domain